MIRLDSPSTEYTEALGAKIASLLKGRDMIAMFGDLGAGKTAFTRGLCAGLGITDGVSSPTFAIVNAYQGKFPVYLFAVGYYDYLGTGVIIIEWSENIEEELEPDCIRVTIRKTENENERIFEIEGLDEYADVLC